MSQRENGVAIICGEADRQCELCGEIEETRPYGPNGERICFSCGEKYIKTTKKMVLKVLCGIDEKGQTNESKVQNSS